MVLDRFFKPKWQHKKAQVRLQAVAQLDPQNKDQLGVLRTLAIGDNEPTVQKAAVERINRIQPLEEMLKNHPDKQLEHWLTQQIAHLLAHKHAKELDETEQVQYIQKCSHQQIIQYVALNAELSTLQLAAIKKLENESDLSQVVVNAGSSTLRYAAAERIHSKQALTEIVKLIKNKDKKVTRLIRDKLSLLEQTQNQEIEQQRALEDNVRALEKLAQSTYSQPFENRLKGITLKWKQFTEGEKKPFLSRHQTALQQCQEIVANHQQKQEALQHQEMALNSAREEQVNTCELLESCLAGLQDQIQQNKLDEPALNAVISSQKTRWEVACQHVAPDAKTKQRYQDSNALLIQLLSANQRLKEKENAAESLLNSDELTPTNPKDTQRSIEKLAQHVAWPNAFQPHPTLKKLAALSEHLRSIEKDQRQQIEQRLKKLNDTLARIKDSIQQGHFKAAGKLSKEARKELSALPPHKTKSISREFHALQNTIKEFTDWQGFATTPKKDQLIEKMEQLVDADIDIEDKADQIRILQDQWKQLGPSDPKVSKSQWERFKSAADKAYEPCKAYFQDKSLQRGENLSKRTEVCEQLESYLEHMDWANADWKKVEEVHQVARQEWQKYSPVDRSAGKEVQQRFNRLLKSIQQHIDTEKNQNAEQKNQLIIQAEQLLEETDLNKAIEGIKSLQADWKKIGITQYKQSRHQWKQFREHCDAIFARRDQQRNDNLANQQSQVAQADAICQSFEALIKEDHRHILQNRGTPNQLQSQLYELTNLPTGKRKSIEKRFAQLNDAFEQAFLSAQHQQLLDNFRIAHQSANLCQQVEQQAFSNDKATNPDTLKTEWPSGFEDLAPKWQAILTTRLTQGIAKITEAKDTSNTSDEAIPPQLEQLENICIGMEILSNIESPAEAQSKRMAYQVNRLSSGLGQNAQTKTKQEQMIELELKWLQQPWLNNPAYSELQARHEKAIEAFREESTPS